MMVVIVLSAIVAGLAFTVLNIVQKNMNHIETNYEYQSQLQSLEVSLTIDFNLYSKANWDSQNNILTFSSPIKKQNYQFYKDSIALDSKTFYVKTKNKDFFFKGKSTITGDIDAIKLTFDKTKDSYRIFVYKHNDPTIEF